jgi:predicted kinase
MTAPLVIVISGLPCSGKTALGRRIASRFSLPFISKDDFKERLFDTLGWTDRAWSKKLSAASYSLMFGVLKAELEAGCSCILEGNFDLVVHSQTFAALKHTHDFEVVQVHCITDADVLLERFQARWARGERHPGHADNVTFPEMQALVTEKRAPLEIGGTVWELDTTHLEQLDEGELFSIIASQLERDGG